MDVVLDDRGERPGAMFADWELIGVSYRVVIGDRSLKECMVEFQSRTDKQAQMIALNAIQEKLVNAIATSKITF
jgi:prolyl-tRNA synthetase